jgi:hypothetical protein
MRANPPMIRFLAAIGYTVQKVRPLVYNPREVAAAEKLRAELKKTTNQNRGGRSG